jgi:hypothetical protein
MMGRTLDMVVILLCAVGLSYAQNESDVDTLQTVGSSEVERLLENSQDERGVLADELDWLREHPANLCTATIEDLQQIPSVTRLLAQNIVTMRQQQQYNSIADLLNVEGMTQEQFITMRPYVIAVPQSAALYSVQYRTRSASEVEQRKGYRENVYQGSSLKEYNRLTASVADSAEIFLGISALEVGALAEKDAGERALTDFTTAYVAGIIPALHARFIIGDYLFESAAGLVFNQSYLVSKSSDVIAPVRNNGTGIRPFRSTNENGYFHGIAASAEWNTIKMQMMFSRHAINATVDSMGAITSFDASGLFRTENEQAHRNSASEQIIGGRVSWHPWREWNFGATAYHSDFDHSFDPAAADPVTINQLNVQGIDVSYTTAYTDVFSEIAFSQHARAWIAGVTAKPISSLELSLVTRDYSPDFLNLHASAFGEHGDQVKNETGVYSAVRIQILPWFRASTYYDQFRFPQLDAQTGVAGTGNEALGFIEIRLNRRCEVELCAKRKSTPELCGAVDEFGRTIQQTSSRVQHNYKLTTNINALHASQLSTRIECVRVEESGTHVDEYGFFLSQSVQWKMLKRLQTYLQVTMYKTDSYNSRLYRYEDELPGAFTNALLFGEGVRWYVLLQYEMGNTVQLYAKYTCSVKNGVHTLGTGWDEIQGNTLQQISMQMDVKW